MSLPRLLERAARPTLLLAQPGLEPPTVPDGVHVHPLGQEPTLDDDTRWGCVVVAAGDRAALRAGTESPTQLGRTRAVVTWLAQATTPLVPQVRPEWPEPLELDAHVTDDGGAVTRLRFSAVTPVHEVLARLGIDAGSPGTAARGGLVVGGEDGPDARVPADVLRSGTPSAETSPVTGRTALAAPADGLVVVDEGVLNPAGFRRDWDRPVVDLPAGVALPSGRVTEVTVAELRDAQGVRVPAGAAAYDVAALAMAGVPLVAGPTTGWRAPDGLAPPLAALVTAEVDLGDPLAREEQSVRLRRAAAAGHSRLAERRLLAAAAGVRVSDQPTVSVVLATRRRDLLDFALAQVTKQQGADLELVLAPHGFDVDAGWLRERLGDVPVVVRPAAPDARFGDVLHAAAQAASGEVVLKMDDDDWYGPDVVTDLLWARRTSGAQLVGMPAELVYLEQLGITVRRRAMVERPARVVAGGTMLIGRDDLRAVGSFRSVVKYVDAQLLAAVRLAGGQVYRTQGLGYLLRRGAEGHTWGTDLGYFLSRRRVAAQWRGFRPSSLLAVDDAELPGHAARPAAVS